MKCNWKFNFILFLSLIFPSLYGQRLSIDSLKNELKKATHDTLRLFILYNLSVNVVNDEDATRYSIEMGKIAEKNLLTNPPERLKKIYLKRLAAAFNNTGLMYKNKGDILKALSYYNKALQIQKDVNNKRGISTSLNNIAVIFEKQGNSEKALDNYLQSLRINEELQDKVGIALSYNNIGSIFANQNNPEEALSYFNKGLKLYEEIQDKKGIAMILINIGAVYQGKVVSGDNSATLLKAMDCYERSLKIRREQGNKKGIASCLKRIASVYKKQGRTEEALNSLFESLKLSEELGIKDLTSGTLEKIGEIYFEKKDHAKALAYALKALKLGKELGYPANIKNASEELYKIYKSMGKGNEALAMHELFIQMRDSLNNEDIRQKNYKKQVEFEYSKQAFSDSTNNATLLIQEQLKHEDSLKQQKLFTYSGIIGFLLMLIVAAISIKAYKTKQKANLTISKQKHLVELKQKEIIDSINYAKKIQTALMTNEKYIDKNIDRLMKRE